jgi:2-oxoisovalerate dehydrogenase E1 component
MLSTAADVLTGCPRSQGEILAEARALAERGASSLAAFVESAGGRRLVEQALLIRAVETELLRLFAAGRLHGTIHTCVGQEFSGVVIGRELRDGDFVTSSHRCHGHFIGATGNWQGLIDEIVGNARGVCAGIGSSQHLYSPQFISNGVQASLLPVAAGVALDRQRRDTGNLVISFIGEGTLGEGLTYETFNFDCLHGLPHLVVCENNYYIQSTPQAESVAGDILQRAGSFGMRCAVADTWNPGALQETARALMEEVRHGRPGFLLVRTFRLNAHSKGDDTRDKEEIGWFNDHDPLTTLVRDFPELSDLHDGLLRQVRRYADEALTVASCDPALYFRDQLPIRIHRGWTAVPPDGGDGRLVQRLNAFYDGYLRDRPDAYFLGEDIADPYGGAFKVSRGFTTSFPDRALTTPLSEACITGVGIGLAITGARPLVEVMFGDFMTLTVDQLVNNASKFHHMYNRKVSCPVVVRAPMGGRRGYGPTHSQSLERLFVGLDNCLALSLHSLADPKVQLAALGEQLAPTVLFENKTDYTNRLFTPPDGFVLERDDTAFPTFRLRPDGAEPTATIVSYGGMARIVCDAVLMLFERADVLAEVIVPTCLHPLDMTPIVASTTRTGVLVVVEEGPSYASVGAEILAAAVEQGGAGFRALRLGKRPVAIPSVPALENQTLPTADRLCRELAALLGRECAG